MHNERVTNALLMRYKRVANVGNSNMLQIRLKRVTNVLLMRNERVSNVLLMCCLRVSKMLLMCH